MRAHLIALASIAIAAPAIGQAPSLHIDFTPKNDSFAAAAAEYRDIWASEGARMVAALEAAAGMRFEPGPVGAIVMEAASNSGFRDIPMTLRASYPPDTKKATLLHELGHRLQSPLFRKDEDVHPALFLILYDVWVAMYGKPFADQQVVVESRRKGVYDYESAWKTALAMTPDERAAKWKALRDSRRYGFVALICSASLSAE